MCIYVCTVYVYLLLFVCSVCLCSMLCMCGMYLCMYVCLLMYVRMYVCINGIFTYVCIFLCEDDDMRVFIHLYV
jgi:nuclear pore complex protein Nup62